MIGIVILNYNTWQDVIKCITSINENVKYTDYLIYIIDNASTDDSLKQLKQYYINDNKITIKSSMYNGGYSYGNNVGIKLAIKDGAQKILILNPDVIFLNDVVSILKKHLEAYKNVGIIGPCIYDSFKNKIGFMRKNYSFRYAFFERKPINIVLRYLKSCNINYDYSLNQSWEFAGMVSGCCFMINASLFKALDLFDDHVFLYAEEYILGLKLLKRNLLAMYDVDAKIIHNHGSSTQKIGNAFVNYHEYRSCFYTLLNYCNCKGWQYYLIYFQLIFLYAFRSIYRRDYKKRFRSFRNEMKKLLNIHNKNIE